MLFLKVISLFSPRLVQRDILNYFFFWIVSSTSCWFEHIDHSVLSLNGVEKPHRFSKNFSVKRSTDHSILGSNSQWGAHSAEANMTSKCALEYPQLFIIAYDAIKSSQLLFFFKIKISRDIFFLLFFWRVSVSQHHTNFLNYDSDSV